MHTNGGILIALLVVLILVVVFLGRGAHGAGCGCAKCGSCAPGCGCPKCSGKDGFAGSDPTISPYTEISHQDGAMRHARHDAYNQDHAYLKADLAKNYRAWAAAPRDLEEAQRAAWFAATSNGENESYDPETGGDAAAEMGSHHTPGPAINYQDALVDLVADPRMNAQHANWHSEISAKSQGALKVDTIDEAAAISTQGGHGIYAFRFPGSKVSQHNALFITEESAESQGVQATPFSIGI